jgi:hemerythrin-like domain-containing protein
MKHAENFVQLKIQHIRMEDDEMLFEFAKSKGHQGGEEYVGL